MLIFNGSSVANNKLAIPNLWIEFILWDDFPIVNRNSLLIK